MGLYFHITSMDHGVAQNTGVGAMMLGMLYLELLWMHINETQYLLAFMMWKLSKQLESYWCECDLDQPINN